MKKIGIAISICSIIFICVLVYDHLRPHHPVIKQKDQYCKTEQINQDLEGILFPVRCLSGFLGSTYHYAYVNLDGNVVLDDPSWDYAGWFEDNGLAIIGQKRYFNLINKFGEIMLDEAFKHIHYLGHNYYFMQTLDQNFIAKYENNRFHFEITEYTWIYEFSEGLAAFKTDTDQIGYINLALEVVISPQYDYDIFLSNQYRFQFQDGRSILKQNSKYGMIDQNNEVVISFEYDLLRQNSDYYEIEKGGLKGLLNHNLEWILGCNYAALGKVAPNNFVAVSRDGIHYAFFNLQTREYLTDNQYYDIADYHRVNHYHDFQYPFVITSLDQEKYQLLNHHFQPLLEESVEILKIINQEYVVLGSNSNFKVLNVALNQATMLQGLDVEVYPDFPLVAVAFDIDPEGVTLFQLFDLTGELLYPDLIIYDQMELKIIAGQEYLLFTGELQGKAFSSYLTKDLNILWLPK